MYQKKKIDQWFLSLDCSLFPRGEDYKLRYRGILDYLHKYVYPKIELDVLWNEINQLRTPLYLNDHGEKHVNKVIERVTDLVRLAKTELNPYETYILLVAILLHDAANIKGRINHQDNIHEIINDLMPIIGIDSVEHMIIKNIAAVHCGSINGSKDTIKSLQEISPFHNIEIRQRLLASLLRFADELADDDSRANRYIVGRIPLFGSEIYHSYSLALHTVFIKSNDIDLKYSFNKSQAYRSFTLNGSTSLLLDYIYSRTLKMFIEKIYCSRYLKSFLELNRIRVTIEIIPDILGTTPIEHPLKEIGYTLEERGYPTDSYSINIRDICDIILPAGIDVNNELNYS